MNYINYVLKGKRGKNMEVTFLENEIFKIMVTQGAFAILFLYLLFHVLKENSNSDKNF